jgi:hypothetical protein
MWCPENSGEIVVSPIIFISRTCRAIVSIVDFTMVLEQL